MRTAVLSGSEWLPFQEFMVRHRAAGPVEGVDFRGAPAASPTPAVLEAIAGAEAIVIGPSNPVASIGPMLSIPGLGQAIRDAPAPVVAVSPIVGGEVLKGPTEPFLRWLRVDATAEGIAGFYDDLLDGLVCDEEPGIPVPALVTDTLMHDAKSRTRLARETLHFARGLA